MGLKRKIRILDNLDTFLLAGHMRSHDPLDSYKAKVIKVIAKKKKKYLIGNVMSHISLVGVMMNLDQRVIKN